MVRMARTELVGTSGMSLHLGSTAEYVNALEGYNVHDIRLEMPNRALALCVSCMVDSHWCLSYDCVLF